MLKKGIKEELERDADAQLKKRLKTLYIVAVIVAALLLFSLWLADTYGL